jgi:hypothetical protein
MKATNAILFVSALVCYTTFAAEVFDEAKAAQVLERMRQEAAVRLGNMTPEEQTRLREMGLEQMERDAAKREPGEGGFYVFRVGFPGLCKGSSKAKALRVWGEPALIIPPGLEPAGLYKEEKWIWTNGQPSGVYFDEAGRVCEPTHIRAGVKDGKLLLEPLSAAELRAMDPETKLRAFLAWTERYAELFESLFSSGRLTNNPALPR